jgi:hypothetical protein
LETPEYYPLVEKQPISKHVNGLIKNFNDSASQFAFFSLPMRPTYRKNCKSLEIVDSAIQKKEK